MCAGGKGMDNVPSVACENAARTNHRQAQVAVFPGLLMLTRLAQ